jgi:nucleoside phosphorylase
MADGVLAGSACSYLELIANANFRDKLLDAFHRAIGGDMESYGVAQACRALGIESIAAKGICDWRMFLVTRCNCGHGIRA